MKTQSKKSIQFKFKNEKINLSALELKTPFEKARGLTFKTRKNAKALLFEMKNPMAIHSFFVFFPFIAIWLDKNNNVIDTKKVRPFKFHIKPKKKFSKLVEIPINNRYKEIIDKIIR
ncbi:hypothetical protein GF378_00860 [Candidatus Pacearchaeota archaeon]|nr:hypothetical protein [Candidatus Pacearchaeota archaeon]